MPLTVPAQDPWVPVGPYGPYRAIYRALWALYRALHRALYIGPIGPYIGPYGAPYEPRKQKWVEPGPSFLVFLVWAAEAKMGGARAVIFGISGWVWADLGRERERRKRRAGAYIMYALGRFLAETMRGGRAHT